MDETSILTIVTSVIAALGGTQAWEFYQKKSEQRRDAEMAERNDLNLYRDDLRKEVEALRAKVELLNQEKQEQMKGFLVKINDLSQELAAMKVRVEFLERENKNLREKP